MRTLRLALAILTFVVAPALPAQGSLPAPQSAGTVLYDIRFPNAVHREGEVTITFRDVPAGPLTVQMARSSPGRYALHEFAKNVYRVRASDAAGNALATERISPHAWQVSGHRGEVRFQYTLFADRADGTYAGIDPTRAHLNIPATFAFAPTLAQRPIQVTFHPVDPSWKVATQLEPTAHPWTFRAPDLQYFFDSPTHLGPLDIREWQVTSGGRRQTIRLAVNHLGSAEDVTRFTDLTRRVVDEMAAVFGELPRFDYGSYTFISCYRPNCAGDGMEHRNSTSLTASSSLATSAPGLLGTVSHEFFHAWNVERIRPASLEPFDFTEANMSRELWFAEGFTSYYGPLVIARAGISTPQQFARQLSGPVNTLVTQPGRGYDSPVGMSQQAPFVDAAVSIDPNNRSNTFISYYTYGQALGLALDLTLRARMPSRTLDDLMQEMWRRFGAQTDRLAPAKGYTVEDIEQALAHISGDAEFARDFFARFIHGSELPDYPALLARAGFIVRPVTANAWMGDLRLSLQQGGLVVGASSVGSPAYEAGIAVGDRVTRIGDTQLTRPEQLPELLSQRKPGDRLRVTWQGRDGERSAEVTLTTDPRVEVLAFEDAGQTPSAAQLAFRSAWLGSARR